MQKDRYAHAIAQSYNGLIAPPNFFSNPVEQTK